MNDILALLDNILTLLRDNMSAIFALLGVAVGALFSFWASSVLKKKEAGFRVTEKILDQGIQSHQEIAEWASSLNLQCGIGYYEDNEKTTILIPGFMRSLGSYMEASQEFGDLFARHELWLSSKANEEVQILSLYLGELDKILVHGHQENIWAISTVIVDDFTYLIARIQNACYKFLTRDVFSLNVPAMRVSIGKKIIERRKNLLANFALFSQREYIEMIAGIDPCEIEQRLSFVLFDHFKRHLASRDIENEDGNSTNTNSLSESKTWPNGLIEEILPYVKIIFLFGQLPVDEQEEMLRIAKNMVQEREMKE